MAMRAVLLIATGLAASSSSTEVAWRSAVVPEVVGWAEYKQLFGRDYASAAEERRRRGIFQQSVAFVRAHNAENDAGRSGYRLGVNNFSDLEHEEWERDYVRSNATDWPVPSKASGASAELHEPPAAMRGAPNGTCTLFRHNLTQYTDGTVIGFTQAPNAAECCVACTKNTACQNYNYQFGTGCTLYSNVPLGANTEPGGPDDACGGRTDPNNVDWVDKGAVTPIKNQGQCGGCWAFAAVGATESSWQIATGELISLSEQQLMDCSNQGACLGGVVQSGFLYIQYKGLDSDRSYNYTDDRKNTGQKRCWKAGENRTVATIDKYTEVMSGGDPNCTKNGGDPACETQLAAAVRVNPVAVGIDGASPAVQHYKSGVLGNESDCPLLPSHAVLVVGFTPDYWIIK